MNSKIREALYLLFAMCWVATAEWRVHKAKERTKEYSRMVDQSLAVATNTQATCEKLLFENEVLRNYILQTRKPDA